MAGKWMSTKFPGVYYREHLTRRQGARLDRYYAIKYTLRGKQKWEGIGWASEGYGLDKAQEMRATVLRNIRSGSGPQSLAEVRQEVQRQRTRKEAGLAMTFALGVELYGSWAAANASVGWETDEARLRLHVLPEIGDMPLEHITTATIERLKQLLCAKTIKGGSHLAASTILKIITLVGTVFNHLADTPVDPDDPNSRRVFQGRNPAKITRKAGKPGRVYIPRNDASRLRIFTLEEIVRILEEACIYGQAMHDMVLLALDTGLRASEICGLRSEYVGPGAGSLAITDTKTRRDRVVFPRRSKHMLLERLLGHAGHLFPARDGGPTRVDVVTNAFERIATRAWINDGITDQRMRGTFHGTRHWFGAMEYLRTHDLHHVQVLMGHDQISTTQRYVKYGEILKASGSVVFLEHIVY